MKNIFYNVVLSSLLLICASSLPVEVQQQLTSAASNGVTVIFAKSKDYSYVSQSVWLDENNLLFLGKKTESRGELWKLNVDSESIQKVDVPGQWLRDFVTLSPDWKAVVVCTMSNNEQTKWSLWHYSLESPQEERITDGMEDVSPCWRS